jgi:hypothetical protein
LATIGIINGEVDSSKAISETDEELVIPAILAREAVLPYPKGKAYRSAQELEDALFTFSKAWVTAEKHPEPLISIVTDRKRQIKGELSDIKLDADAVNPAGKKSPAVRANVHLFKKTLSKAFIDDVKSGTRKDVSVGFTYDTVEKTGEWQGEKYDYAQENLLINHVAVGVPVGRMRAPFIGLGCDAVDFEVPESDAMNVEEIDAKIKSLQEEKDKLDAELCAIYSERNDKEKELQTKIQELYTQFPKTDLKVKTDAIYAQLDELSAQIVLFRKVKVEKVVGQELEGVDPAGKTEGAISADGVEASKTPVNPVISAKPEVTLPITHENTSNLIGKLKQIANW